MNLEETLAEMLNKTMAGIDAGTEFLSAELPDVIQQAILWHLTYTGILFVFSVIAAIALIKVDIYIYKRGMREEGWLVNHNGKLDENAFVLGYLFLGSLVRGATWVALVITPFNLVWLKIWIAPKLWLVEYSASLIK